MSSYSFVSRAYPKPYRADHLAELVDTANELNDHRWSQREARCLLAGGLRTRCRLATNGDASIAVARGVRLGVFLTLFVKASFALAMLLGASNSGGSIARPPLAPNMSVDVVLLLGMVALWRGARWPTTVLLTLGLAIRGATTVVVYLGQPRVGMQYDPLAFADIGIIASLLQLLAMVGAILWLHRHGREQSALPLRHIVGLIAFTTSLYAVFGLFGALSVLTIALMLALPVAALLLAPFDPRLCVATAVVWTLMLTQVTASFLYQGAWLLLIVPILLVTGAAFVARLSTRQMARF